MLTRRAVLTLATVLTVVGSTAGCQAERPPAGRTAVVDSAPGRPADPLADLDAALDAVERDPDAAAEAG